MEAVCSIPRGTLMGNGGERYGGWDQMGADALWWWLLGRSCRPGAGQLLDPVGRLTAPNLSSHSGADKVHTRRFNDKKHTVEAVEECVRLFGHAPKAYAYDRGGYSE